MMPQSERNDRRREAAVHGQCSGRPQRLKQEWIAVDTAYFGAVGALSSPLSASDSITSGAWLPSVSAVFCKVDGGRQYTLRYRHDAAEVHLQLMAVVQSVLRQVWTCSIK